MNVLIASTKLANAGRIAALAVRANRRVPILECCRLTAGDNLGIYGTDLDTSIEAVADCDVLEPGEAIIDAGRLAGIAAKLRGDVCLSHVASDLIIKCGRSRFTLTMQEPGNFPAPLAVDGGDPIALTPADVIALFAGAAAASATDDRRVYLSGPVLFREPSDFGHHLCGAGADGVALSYAATTAACPDLGAGVIVHRDTCKLAVELFGKTSAALRISQNLIELASDSVRLVAKLVDSVPTAWRSFVPPADATNFVSVASKDLKASLDRCFAVINNLVGDLAKRAPSITVRWDVAAGDGIRIAFRNIKHEAPAVRDVVPAAKISGRAAISLNLKLLQRLLNGLDTESIRLSTGDHRSDALRIDAGPDRYAVLSQIREFSHLEEEAA